MDRACEEYETRNACKTLLGDTDEMKLKNTRQEMHAKLYSGILTR